MQLICAQGTLRHAPFPERVAAAAAAGFDGIGLSTGAYGRLREQGWTDAGLRALLSDAGVDLLESEGVLGFSSRGAVVAGPLAGRAYADPEVERRLYAMADAFGLRHVMVNAAFEGALEADAPAAFAALCDRAADHGLLVALEPVACSSVPDAATACRVVREAGRPNGGVCVDSWHVFRGAPGAADLPGLDGDLVLVVQLDDGPLVPRDEDYLVDTLHGRAVPGNGEFDLTGLLRRLDRLGVVAPVSVEVLSDELDALAPGEAARRAADGTRAVLAAAQTAGAGA